MSEDMLAKIGCVVLPLAIVYFIYRIVHVFKMNGLNSETTTCRITKILKIKMHFITYWIRYTVEYFVGEKKFTNEIGVPSFVFFTEEELEKGVPVRYLKSDPDQVEFIAMSRGTRVFGWLVLVAACGVASAFCVMIALGC